MPSKKTSAKNRKRRKNSKKKRPLNPPPIPTTVPPPDVVAKTDATVYQTEPNTSWINVRWLSHLVGTVTSLGCYSWSTALRHVTLKGTITWVLVPMLTPKSVDGVRGECLSLNTFAWTCLILWSAHFMRRLNEVISVQSFYRSMDYSEILTTFFVDGSLALINGVSNNIYV